MAKGNIGFYIQGQDEDEDDDEEYPRNEIQTKTARVIIGIFDAILENGGTAHIDHWGWVAMRPYQMFGRQGLDSYIFKDWIQVEVETEQVRRDLDRNVDRERCCGDGTLVGIHHGLA